MCRVLPVPKGALDIGDRVHMWLYRGLAAIGGGGGGTFGIGPWNAYQQFVAVAYPTTIFPRV